MEVLLIALIWCLNLGISYLNAKGCGYAWAEAKAHGGYPQFFVWVVAIMSALGFVWCFTIAEVFLALSLGLIGLPVAKAALALGYILVIPGILATGFIIMVDSWARAYKQGGVLNYGVAAYNTYAQVHNTYHAIEGIGSAFGSVGEAFSGDGEDALTVVGIVVVCLIVLSSLILGIATTRYLILKTAAANDLPDLATMQARRR